MDFNQLGLDDALLRAIEATGYTIPTQVQIRAIPAALKGHPAGNAFDRQ